MIIAHSGCSVSATCRYVILAWGGGCRLRGLDFSLYVVASAQYSIFIHFAYALLALQLCVSVVCCRDRQPGQSKHKLGLDQQRSQSRAALRPSAAAHHGHSAHVPGQHRQHRCLAVAAAAAAGAALCSVAAALVVRVWQEANAGKTEYLSEVFM